MNSKMYPVMTIGMFFIAAMGMSGIPARAIEKPPYEVLEKSGRFELRRYPSYIVAETYVEGEFADVGNEGFRRLAAYIKGDNTKRTSIEMTAPVNQEAQSEKIKMTAPVSQENSGNRWRITFVMPSKYTLDTLPTPTDTRIALGQEPPRTMAVIRYSGTWSRSRYDTHKTELLQWIDSKGWKHMGRPVWARYNPPFMPWFFRRNEILVPVKAP